MDEKVRIYYYGDSGPYGDWESTTETRASDGFGRCDVHEVPAALWSSYLRLKEAIAAIESQFDQAPKVQP